MPAPEPPDGRVAGRDEAVDWKARHQIGVPVVVAAAGSYDKQGVADAVDAYNRSHRLPN